MPKLCRLLVFRRLVQEKGRIAMWNVSDDEDESLFLFVNWRFLGPRGPLVLPLIDPSVRKKNLDHLYTGIHA